MARFWALVIGLIFVGYVSSQQGPTVTLPHGGQLKGISTTSQKTPIDVFLGMFATILYSNIVLIGTQLTDIQFAFNDFLDTFCYSTHMYYYVM